MKNEPRWKAYRRSIRSFSDIFEIHTEMDSDSAEWVFRGQAGHSNRLESTLERCFLDFGIAKREFLPIELALLHEFRRYYHLYGPTPAPAPDDTLAYLALMRHYGSPARLLDFTFSLFVACFFAIERASRNPVVWAVNKTWLTKHFIGHVKAQKDGEYLLKLLAAREGRAFDEVFVQNRSKVALVGPVNPSFMNDRIAVQKGLFLSATDISRPFRQVLWSMPQSKENVMKIRVSPKARRDLLLVFERMNITRVGLFPGLQGFGESLYGKVLLFKRLERMRRRGGRLGPRSLGL